MVNVIEFLTTAFEVILIMSYMNSALVKKYRKRFIYIGVTIIFTLIITLFDYFRVYTNYKVLYLMTVLTVISFLLYTDKWYKKIFAVVLINAFLLLADLITYYIDKSITPYFQSINESRVFMIFISKTIFFMVIKLFEKRKLNEYKDINISILYFSLILTVPLISIIFFLSIYYIFDKYNISLPIMMIVSILMLFLNIFILYVFEIILKTVKINSESLLMKKQYEMQIENYKYMAEKQNVIKSIKHDINNHLLCIKELVNRNRYEDLKQYLNGVVEKMDKSRIYSETGNIVLDFIINEKCEIAKSKNIKINVNIELDNRINIKDDDLCIILTNLFDNAITATKDTNGYINIYLTTKKDMFSIIFENSFVGELDKNNLNTKKKDKKLHGIGLKNIEAIVKKYSGTYKLDINNNVFKTIILIPKN